MLEGGILVAAQSVIQQPKRSYDLQLSILVFTELDRQLERPYLINQLVMLALFQIFAKIWIRGQWL